MTVRELIEMLETLDQDMPVVLMGGNSGGYVDSIDDYILEGSVRTFYGEDYDAVVIHGNQVGMI